MPIAGFLAAVVIAGFVNIWLHSPMVTWVSSVIGVFVFVGLTAFDAQQIKYMAANAASISNEDARRASVMGALRLYLDFVNMFLYLLQLFGGRNRAARPAPTWYPEANRKPSSPRSADPSCRRLRTW